MADSINTTNIETIIQLRHDTQEKWNSTNGKDTHLEPGEAAVEIIGNKVKVKIGTEECDTFETAPYIGGEDAQVFQSEIKNYNSNDMTVIDEYLAAKEDELPDGEVIELHDGDVFIVKKYIASTNTGKHSSTAYVYDASLEQWVAMDGNYNANNVIFSDNITITQNVGNVTVTNGNGEIPCAGKSLAELFQILYTKEDLNISVTQPSVSFNINSRTDSKDEALTGEIGTTFTRPSATLKITGTGSYEYNCKDASNNTYGKNETNVSFDYLKVAGNSTKTNVDTKTEVDAQTTSVAENTSKNLKTGTYVTYTASSTDIPSNKFTSTKVYYYFGCAAKSTASDRKPLTNLGNFRKSDTENTTVYSEGTRGIEAKENYTSVRTWSAQGWRGWFQGYKASGSELNVASLTSANIRGLSNARNGSFATSTSNVPVGTNQLIFACPTNKINFTLKSDGVTVDTGFTAAQSTPATPLTVKHTTASVAAADGNDAITYDVFYCENVGFIDVQTVTITYKTK